MTIHEHLEDINSCGKSRAWALQYNTAEEVWNNCTQPAWLAWWLVHCKAPARLLLDVGLIKALTDHYNLCYFDYRDLGWFAVSSIRTRVDRSSRGLKDTYENPEMCDIIRQHATIPWRESDDISGI